MAGYLRAEGMPRGQYTAATVADWTLTSVLGGTSGVGLGAATAKTASWSIWTIVAAGVSVAAVASISATAAVLLVAEAEVQGPSAPPATPPYPPPVPFEMRIDPVSFGTLHDCRVWHETSGDRLQQPGVEPSIAQNAQGIALLSVRHDLMHAEPASMVFVAPSDAPAEGCIDKLLGAGTSIFRVIVLRPDSPRNTKSSSFSSLAAAIAVRGGLSHVDATRVLCERVVRPNHLDTDCDSSPNYECVNGTVNMCRRSKDAEEILQNFDVSTFRPVDAITSGSQTADLRWAADVSNFEQFLSYVIQQTPCAVNGSYACGSCDFCGNATGDLDVQMAALELLADEALSHNINPSYNASVLVSVVQAISAQFGNFPVEEEYLVRMANTLAELTTQTLLSLTALSARSFDSLQLKAQSVCEELSSIWNYTSACSDLQVAALLS
jgi:hypothetical protein